MRIYDAEKKAGVKFSVDDAGNSSSFVSAKVRVGDIAKYFDGMSAAELIKTRSTVQTVEELLGQEQPDLALVVAILVSTGWNLNDDIFTPAEVWRARTSPVHKPMNDNHRADKILGHIVQAKALDKSGVEIELNEGDSPPEEFDIEVAGVLYRFFPELADRIDEIITKAQSGEIYVSMEAWFPDFGYGIIDPTTGATKLVERNDQTAFLTKHLRSYGGTGEYLGYKIGRVLKDIVFGAQGFVDTPANPESVIKVAANVFVAAELNELLRGGAEDVDEKELKKLQVELEEAKTALETEAGKVAELQKASEDFQARNYEGQIAVLTSKAEELTVRDKDASERIDELKAENAELQKQFDGAIERAEKSEAEVHGIRKTEQARERLSKLSEVKQVDDPEATLAELREMTEETFAVVLKYAGNDAKVNADTEDKADDEVVLDDVEETKDADLTVADDGVESEKSSWVSMAMKLTCREEEKDEGGE